MDRKEMIVVGVQNSVTQGIRNRKGKREHAVYLHC